MAPQQQLIFRSGEARVAIAAAAVAEIAPLPRLTRAPRAPDILLGVAQLRSRVTPVLSTGAIIGLSGQGERPARAIVLRRTPSLALAADAIVALGPAPEGGPALAEGELQVTDADGSRRLDLDAVIAAAFTRSPAPALRQDHGKGQAALAGGMIAFLGIEVAAQPYALPLDQVLEIGPSPDNLLPLPHTEAALLGVADWRGQATPLVSLRELLGLSAGNASHQVVVRLEDRAMALAIDAVTGILRVSSRQVGSAPALFNLGKGEATIRQVLRETDGPGLVAILTPEDLLDDTRMRRWRDEVSAPLPSKGDERSVRGERRLLVRLGGETFGLPLAMVREVTPFPAQLAHLPGGPADLLGVMNFRGRPVPVLDTGARLGGRLAADRRIVIVAGRGEEMGFAVDAAMEIVAVDACAVFPAPPLDAEEDRAFPNAALLGDELVLLADPDVLLDQARADVAATLRRGASAP